MAGTYTVVWQITGADGHPVRGRFTFMLMPGATGLADPTVGPSGEGVVAAASALPPAGGGAHGVAPSGQAPPAATHPAATHHDPTSLPDNPGFDAESPLYVAIRWATFTAILIAIGAVAFHGFVLRLLRRTQAPGSPMLAPASVRAAGIGLWAAAALGVVALLRLYAQSYALQGGEGALDPGMLTAILGRTVWGWGWLLQIVGVALAGLGFLRARRGGRGGGRAGWGIAALGVAALAFSPALSGHAAAVPQLTWLAVLADGAHVIGAGGWLGSLLLVVVVGLPAAHRLPEGERGWGAAELINAFSPTALGFAGIVALTGVFSAWLHMDAVSALWRSGYGQTLLLKLAILSVVAGTGAYNWLRVKPALGGVEGAIRIRRSATLELAVGVLVLVVTAALVATPTPMDDMAVAMEGVPAASDGGAAVVMPMAPVVPVTR